MNVYVVAHDPAWALSYADEANCIRVAVAGCAVELHHIGSTAIPGIFAKPIIDILLVTPELSLIDARVESLEALGYEAMGELGIPGRRYFRKCDDRGTRTHHVHAFERGSHGERRHLAFRDYLLSHPEVAQEYSSLKQRLARDFPNDIESYMNGKDEFIKHHEALAIR